MHSELHMRSARFKRSSFTPPGLALSRERDELIPQFARSDALLQSQLISTSNHFNMTITESTRRQLFDKTNHSVIRVQQKRHAPLNAPTPSLAMGTWTVKEHELFLEGLSLYPSGPWKRVAQHIGSRTPRQVMTHAQKYRQRLQRRAALAVKRDETSRPIPKTLHSDRVLSLVVSPMQMPMQMAMPGGSTGEIHVEAGVCVLPANAGDRPAMFRDDPPPYGHLPVFGLDELFAHLATDHMFDSVDMSLPYADAEPLQF